MSYNKQLPYRVVRRPSLPPRRRLTARGTYKRPRPYELADRGPRGSAGAKRRRNSPLVNPTSSTGAVAPPPAQAAAVACGRQTMSSSHLALAAWGVPPPVSQSYAELGITQLLPWQAACLSKVRSCALGWAQQSGQGLTRVCDSQAGQQFSSPSQPLLRSTHQWRQIVGSRVDHATGKTEARWSEAPADILPRAPPGAPTCRRQSICRQNCSDGGAPRQLGT